MNYLRLANNFTFMQFLPFQFMSHHLQVQPLFVVNFQYQSCKIIVFLPFSLSCSQERIVCLNHKPETKNHGILWTKVLPVRLHNPSMSFVLGMTITLSWSICKMFFLFCIIFAPLESHSCIRSKVMNGCI